MIIQTLADLRTYVSGLVNDPTNTRYTLPLIDAQLDLCQHRWNSEAKICRITDYVILNTNQYRYQISTTLSLAPIQLLRCAFKGIAMNIRSKQYFDRYSAIDWTTTIGTPNDVCIDLNSNATSQSQTGPSLIVHPVPQSGDVSLYTNSVGILNQPPLAVEYLCPHTTMVNGTDTPFLVNGIYVNTLMIPYLAGLGLDAAASILEPDPTAETVAKAKIYRAQANGYLSLVVQMYQGLEEDTPGRMPGGRSWQMGNSGIVQNW